MASEDFKMRTELLLRQAKNVMEKTEPSQNVAWDTRLADIRLKIQRLPVVRKIKNKSDIANLQAEAEREVQEAIEALDRLNEAEARAQELKKKRYGEQKRFGTSGAINRARYSLKEYASYIESGKDYFKSVKKSLSKKF